MPSLAAARDKKPPLKHDIFRDRQHALIEHRPPLVRQPVVQLGAPISIGDQFNAEPDFSQRYRADEKAIKRLRSDEGDDLGFGPGAPQLCEDIGIEQPARHRFTSRTGMRERLDSISMWR